MTIKLTGATAFTIENVNVSVDLTTSVEPVLEYTAGEDLPAKSVICQGESDSKVYLAKADSWTTMPAIGITKGAVSADESVWVYQIGKVTSVRREADFGYDDKIFVSPDTAGKATKTPPETTGNIVQSLGRAVGVSDISLEIDHTCLEIA